MTTTLMKVLVGVCWIGREVCHQAVPVSYDFVSGNVTDSLDYSAVSLIVGRKKINSVKKTFKFSSPSGQTARMSPMYIPPPDGRSLHRLL